MSEKKEGDEQQFADDNRGTQDELEVLKMIIEAHPGLKTRVLNRIREFKMHNSSPKNKLKTRD